MKKIRIIAWFMAFALTLSLGALAASGEGSGELATEIPASAEGRITANLYLDGSTGEQNAAGCIYTATADDQSGAYAKNGAVYTVDGAVFSKPSGILSTATSFTVPTGEVLWSTTEAGSYGINAVALAWGEGTELTLRNCTLHSFNLDENGEPVADDLAIIGANGAFATMSGKLVLDHVDIIAAGEGGHGLDVTSDGIIEINDSSIVTYGKKASGITTDQPGGTVLASNVDVLTHKSGSASVYCDGNSYVLVDGGRLESWVEPAAVVCTDGVLDLFDVEVIGHEDAALNAHFPHLPSTITCVGCSFRSESASAVTSYAATKMHFTDCEFDPAEGCYIVASIPGENSSGGISADEATVTMTDCALEGAIWADEENGAALHLVLENTDWVVTAESVLTTLVIDDASQLQGRMFVDGTETAIEAGRYANVLILPL